MSNNSYRRFEILRMLYDVRNSSIFGGGMTHDQINAALDTLGVGGDAVTLVVQLAPLVGVVGFVGNSAIRVFGLTETGLEFVSRVESERGF